MVKYQNIIQKYQKVWLLPLFLSILFLALCPIELLFLLISLGEYKYFISKIKTNIFSFSTPYLSYTKGSPLHSVSAPGFLFFHKEIQEIFLYQRARTPLLFVL